MQPGGNDPDDYHNLSFSIDVTNYKKVTIGTVSSSNWNVSSVVITIDGFSRSITKATSVDVTNASTFSVKMQKRGANTKLIIDDITIE